MRHRFALATLPVRSNRSDPLTKSTNGRVWKLELDPTDPTQAQLSVLVQGDDHVVKDPGEIHQPDNLETTANGSLLVQEDPSSGNQFPASTTPPDPNRTSARVWRLDLTAAQDASNPAVVAKIATDSTNTIQLGDGGPGDLTPTDNPPFVGGAFALSPGNLGAWESSGIVDASSVFGDGAFLVTVQAHTLWVDSGPGEIDAVAPFGSPDFTNKLEGGQLLLLRLPGV